jgi:hypothetical protein
VHDKELDIRIGPLKLVTDRFEIPNEAAVTLRFKEVNISNLQETTSRVTGPTSERRPKRGEILYIA